MCIFSKKYIELQELFLFTKQTDVTVLIVKFFFHAHFSVKKFDIFHLLLASPEREKRSKKLVQIFAANQSPYKKIKKLNSLAFYIHTKGIQNALNRFLFALKNNIFNIQSYQ